jgi:hypothetical protein
VCSLVVVNRAAADLAALSPDPGIPLQFKEDNNAASHFDEILQQVHTEMQKMEQNPADQPTVSMIRQWLVDEMQIAGNAANTTEEYKETYTKALNKEFLDALSKPDAPVAVRLNIGLVISQLPGRAVNLKPTVCKLLQDPSAAVADVGEKAAEAILPQGLLPTGLAAADLDDLIDNIIKAVTDHPAPPMGAMVADGAYKAINPCLPGWPQNLFPQGNGLATLINANLKLQQQRITLYINTGIPQNPLADTYASYFLMTFSPNRNVWGSMTTNQQVMTIQQASDLIGLAGQRAQGRSANENEDVVDALREEGSWLQQLADGPLQDSGISAAGAGVYKLSRTSTGAEILQACNAVAPALQANNLFATLKPPPDLIAAKSADNTTQPSSTSLAR